MPDDATESAATHSSRLQPSIICMPQLQPWSSAALVPKFTTLKSGMKAQVSLETTIEPHDLVYYLGLEPVLHGRKAKVLPLDHRCLLDRIIKCATQVSKEQNDEQAVGKGPPTSDSPEIYIIFSYLFFLLPIVISDSNKLWCALAINLEKKLKFFKNKNELKKKLCPIGATVQFTKVVVI